jgi:oligosaccharyltransferase complex subunit gamma
MFVSLLSVKYAVRCNSALCDTGGEDIECCVPHFRKISTDVDAYKKGLAQNLKARRTFLHDCRQMSLKFEEHIDDCKLIAHPTPKMRLLRFLVASALPLLALAARKPAASKFDGYLGQALSSSPFEVDDASYNDLTSAPRDYSAAVLLTALDARFGCQLCKMFQPEWEILASSWIKKDRKGDTKVLFATLDFANGRNTFQKLQLQTAPILLLFPPTTGPNAAASQDPVRYDFSGEVTGEMIYGWLTRHLPPLEDGKSYPPFIRPVNYTRIIVSITMLIGFVTFASVAWPYVLPVIQNRNLWAAISLIAVLLFTSGHMFNHIRKVPYVSGNGRGGVQYFAGGFSNQYGMETQIVAAMCK